jgi:hypothetical protein
MNSLKQLKDEGFSTLLYQMYLTDYKIDTYVKAKQT